MSSSSKVFSAMRTTKKMQTSPFITLKLKEFVVLDAADMTLMASVDSPAHAERLCALLNDSSLQKGTEHMNMSDKDNKRLCEMFKLFCLQENLTWADLGFTDHEIRLVNKFLEMPLDLRQTQAE